MPPNNTTPRLAVLIDAENIAAKYADGLFDEVAKLGEASVRRAYGDFSSSRSKGWASILTRHAIDPRQQFSNTSGKNASDILLAMDAMDLLYSGHLGGFCLVSSDSDFAGLAMRIREQGIDVYGFGEQKTPENFRQACKRFIYIENLLFTEPSIDQSPAPVAEPLEKTAAAIPAIAKAFEQLDDEDGWVLLSALGTHLSKLTTDFDPRTYGFRKLSDLVRSTNEFEIASKQGSAMRIRKRSGRPRPASKQRK